MSYKPPVRTPTGTDSAQAIVDALAFGLSIEAVAELMSTTPERILQIVRDPTVIAQIEARREQAFNQLDVGRRLKRRALWAVESLVPRLMELGHDVDAPPGARVAAVAELVKISGLRDREEVIGGQERVVININTGSDTITIEAAGHVDNESDGGEGAIEGEYRIIDSGKGGDNDVRLQDEVQGGGQERAVVPKGRVDGENDVKVNLRTPKATRPKSKASNTKSQFKIKVEK